MASARSKPQTYSRRPRQGEHDFTNPFGDTHSFPAFNIDAAKAGGAMLKTASTRIKSHGSQLSNAEIVREFYRLGAGAYALSYDSGMVSGAENGIDVRFPSLVINAMREQSPATVAEMERYGITSTRGMAEGLAASLGDSHKAGLAMAAYLRAARYPYNHQGEIAFPDAQSLRPLPYRDGGLFHNPAIRKEFDAAIDMKAAGKELKYAGRPNAKTGELIKPALTDAQAMELGYQWGKAARTLGLKRTIHPAQLEEEDRADATRLKLDTPLELAEGGILSKLKRGEATPKQVALFTAGLEAGSRGARKPNPLNIETPADISSVIHTAALKQEFHESKAKIEAGLKTALESFRQLDNVTDPAARAQALKQVEQQMASFGRNALKVAEAKGITVHDALSQTDQQKVLQGFDKEAQDHPERQAELSEKKSNLEMLINAEPELKKKGMAPEGSRPVMSLTGLMESSLLSSMKDPKRNLSGDEAARLLGSYRRTVGDTTPVAKDGALHFSVAPLAVLGSALLGEQIKVANAPTAPSPAQPAVAAAPAAKAKTSTPAAVATATSISEQDMARYQKAIGDILKINDGIKNDHEIEGATAGITVSRELSLAFAKVATKLMKEAGADGRIDPNEYKEMMGLRGRLDDVFGGEKPNVSHVVNADEIRRPDPIRAELRAAQKDLNEKLSRR